MDIKITDNWLRDFLKTRSKAPEIAKNLSLCGPSFERMHKLGKDVLYDIEVTTNRTDSASVLGIAREAGTILPSLGIPAKFIDPLKTLPNLISQTTKPLPLTIRVNPLTSERFTAIVLSGIKIKKSPAKIQDRLTKVGIRPINNVVDLTNYVMCETGQPLHAFDYDSIKGSLMKVDLSTEGETVTTLDSTTHKLPVGSIIIRDQERVIDLAGIMGGLNSGVTEKTKTIVLISSIYNPQKIRTTSLTLAHRTQAATLFEKGLDPEGTLKVLIYAVKSLKRQLPQVKIASELIDIKNYKATKLNLELDHAKLENRIGITISPSKVSKILNSLGFTTKLNTKTKTYSVTVPSFRQKDVTAEMDLIEEVARIYGYHNVPAILPSAVTNQIASNSIFKTEQAIRNLLTLSGFSEIYTSPLISKTDLNKTNKTASNTLKITNPLNEREYMRPSLLPSIAEGMELNQKYQKEINIFEIANIYEPNSRQLLPTETLTLSLASATLTVAEFKGIISLITHKFGLKTETKTPGSNSEFATSADIVYKGKTIGTFGSLPYSSGLFATINVNLLNDLGHLTVSYKPIPIYPPLFEDITFNLKVGQPVGELVAKIYSSSKLIQNVTLVDSFIKGNIAATTVRLEIRDPKKNLTKSDAEHIKSIVSKLSR